MPISKVNMWWFWVHPKDGFQNKFKLFPAAGISTDNLYAFAALFSISL